MYRNASVFLLPPPGLSNTPPVDFSSFPRWRPQTGSSFPCVLDGWRLSESGPVDFSRWTHQGPVRKITSGLLPPPWKTLGITWPYVEQSELIEKARHTHRIPLLNGTRGYDLPLWQTVENDWTNFTRLVTCETYGHIFSADYDCFRLAQSIQTVFNHGGSKPEVVFHDGSWWGGRVFLFLLAGVYYRSV